MKPTPAGSQTVRRLGITVRGIVQGVGFRPFVYNAAVARGLSGWVLNDADTVRIEVEGPAEQIEAFLDCLRKRHPPQAHIAALDVQQLPCNGRQGEGFVIRSSTVSASPQPTIPADLATCEMCLAEIRDPSQRRYGYAFTNCTNCGPRWSIVHKLPYDRMRTTMVQFAMCPQCAAEYSAPTDRRFHAEPIACPVCGPVLRLLDSSGKQLVGGDAALQGAVEALLAGQIVALKGLGGFQLLVDATRPETVGRLRQRKARPDKPFAVMLPSLAEVQRRCRVSCAAAEALLSSAAPIVLLRRRTDPAAVQDVAPGVAPANPYLGVMLPYTPLHHLLMDRLRRPLVCTSGNLSEEPMAVSTAEAIERLGPIADVLLTHNRPIARPVDDSVVRPTASGLQVLRRARGYAPLPVVLGQSVPPLLAVGGHLKNTVAVSVGRQVVISQHIGDLDNLPAVRVFQRAIDDLLEFLQVQPAAIACDMHPDYASTHHAELLAARWDVPLLRVQHHHAHAASCIAEHGLQGPVLAFTWDGTGYGPDGTAWGGEALMCDGPAFHRVAHLRSFPLPGGDRAARQPRRAALGLLFEIFGSQAARYAQQWFAPSELRTLLSMLEQGKHCPRTTSMGRLFDAVACICGLGQQSSFEGQAAMALEFAVYPCEDEPYSLLVSDDWPMIGDWEPMIRAILADVAAGEPVGRISARFHTALAEWAATVARSAGCNQVVLSGGCFQNAILDEWVRRRLSVCGLSVYTHQAIPPNDGGISLGQIAVASWQLHSHGQQHATGNSAEREKLDRIP